MEAQQLTEAPQTSKPKKKSSSKRQGAKAAGKPKVAATSKKKASYARLSLENRKWAARTALETNRPATEIVNMALDAIRTGTKFNVSLHVPAYIRRINESKNNRIKRLEKIAKG